MRILLSMVRFFLFLIEEISMVEKNLIDMIGEMPSDIDKNTNLITEKNTKVSNNTIREEKMEQLKSTIPSL